MRISDWSSDVCSSDLAAVLRGPVDAREAAGEDEALPRPALVRQVGGQDGAVVPRGLALVLRQPGLRLLAEVVDGDRVGRHPPEPSRCWHSANRRSPTPPSRASTGVEPGYLRRSWRRGG